MVTVGFETAASNSDVIGNLARVSCRCVESQIDSASPLLQPLLHMFRTHSPFTNIQQLGDL